MSNNLLIQHGIISGNIHTLYGNMYMAMLLSDVIYGNVILMLYEIIVKCVVIVSHYDPLSFIHKLSTRSVNGYVYD